MLTFNAIVYCFSDPPVLGAKRQMGPSKARIEQGDDFPIFIKYVNYFIYILIIF